MSNARRILPIVAGAVIAVIGLQPEAHANQPEVIGSFQDWTAYTFDEDGSQVCYMASRPTEDRGDYTRRGDIFALITHRPAENSQDVVSFIAGYTYQEGSEVTVNIDGNAYTLFTSGDTAWARDSDTDRAIVQQIREGLELRVEGVSSRGTETTDIYSLRGSMAAHDAITRSCGGS